MLLIVDRDTGRASRFRRALEQEPWDIRIAGTEQEIERRFENTTPDLLLVAHDIPAGGAGPLQLHVDGTTNVHDRCRWVAVIGDATPESIDSAYAAGASDYLTESASSVETQSRLQDQMAIALAYEGFASPRLQLQGESSGLLERAAIGIGYARMPDGRFVGASPYLCEMLGYTRDELLSLSFHDIIDPVFFDDSMREINALAEGKRRFIVDDLKVVRKDGSLIWIQVTLSIVQDGRSGTDHLVGILVDVTERKEVQERLVQSDARFRDIARTMAGWYWELDTTGRFTFVSERSTEYLGFSPEEIVGRTHGSFAVREYAEMVDSEIKTHIESSTMMSGLEAWFERRDSEFICMVTNGVPMTDTEGETVGYRGVSQDVTQIKHADKRIYGSEQRFRRLVQSSADAIVMADRDQRIIEINSSCERLFGYAPEQLEGEPVSMLLPSWDEESDSARLDLVGDSNQAMRWAGLSGATSARRRDGVLFPVEVSRTPLDTEEGQIVSLAIRDVTERWEAARQLADSEERLRLATTEAGIGIWDWDIKSDTMVWDEQMYRLNCADAGRPVETSKDMLSTIGPDDRERARLAFRAAAAGENRFAVDCSISTADESPKFVHLIADIVLDDSGRPVRLVGVCWDITNQVLTEREQRTYQLQLHDLVDARTTELQSEMEQRFRSEDSLREKMEELERFERLAIGRESRMIELKREINELLERVNEPARYNIVE